MPPRRVVIAFVPLLVAVLFLAHGAALAVATTPPATTTTTVSARSSYLQYIYLCVLKRDADQQGLANWLVQPLTSFKTLFESFYSSPEYVSKNYSNQDYVTSLYRCILSREPDAAGLNSYVQTLSQGTARIDLISQFTGSAEFRNGQGAAWQASAGYSLQQTITPMQTPASSAIAAAGMIDVFLIAGQSNAVGLSNNASLSIVPQSGTAYQYYRGAISPAIDPIGAGTGSAWPAFADAYYRATGRKVLLVPAAMSGSAMEAVADTGTGNWDTSGTLYATSNTLVSAAIAAAKNAGYTPQFKGILWSQGETDGLGINGGLPGVSQANYKTAFQIMIAKYRSVYGSSMPFYIFKIGTQVGAPDTAYAQIRSVQDAIPTTDPATFVVFRGAIDFPARGMMVDMWHYTQAGYNEMGKIGAANVVSFSSTNTTTVTPPITTTTTVSARSSYLQYIYLCVLKRDADQQGLANWLAQPLTSFKTLFESFYSSPEYVSKNYSNQDYVTSLYRCILSREPDAAGLNNYVQTLSQGTARIDLISQFTGSAEFKNGQGAAWQASAGYLLQQTVAPVQPPQAPPTVVVQATPATITASWSPKSATISYGGQNPVLSYSSTNATRCSIFNTADGSLIVSGYPSALTWAQGALGTFTASWARTLICYDAAGNASSPDYLTVTVAPF